MRLECTSGLCSSGCLICVNWLTETPTWTGGNPYDHNVLLYLSGFNPKITEFRGFREQDILDYIERVKELDPNYDAADVTKVFEYSAKSAIARVLARHPDLKLKLATYMCNQEEENKHIRNGLGPLIHHLRVHDGYALRSQHQSVRKLSVMLTSSFSSNLGLLPNVEDVRLLGPFKAFDLRSSFQSLLEIKNLRRLVLSDFCQWTEIYLPMFQSILMKPTLKHLEFKGGSLMKLVKAVLDCERNDFKSLSISGVKVKDEIITISKPINFSFVRLFSKFKRIKEIIIETDDKEFSEQFRSEIKEIVETLPRNRSLRVKIDGDVYNY